VCAFHCAVLYGPEGAPTQIELYEEPYPSVMAWPEIWVPVEDKGPIIIERFRKKPDGYLASLGCESVESVYRQIEERLRDAGMIDEYFSLDYDVKRRPNEPWPASALWVVAFPVVGGSEGHYIHVEALWSPDGPSDLYGKRRLLMLGKTFQGWDHAWKMAMFIAQLLEDASWGHVEEEPCPVCEGVSQGHTCCPPKE